MTKQTIGVGTVVDDGTGDYLRQGGLKINQNFDDIYNKLGDTQNVFPAGAWRTHNFTDGTTLTVAFGDAWIINTTGGSVTIELPNGSPADHGKVIRIRDANGLWDSNNVRINAQSGDTIKGNSGITEFDRKYQDLELVYSAPSRWEYAPQRRVDNLSFTDTPSVVRRAFLATANQRDFDIFAAIGGEYNIGAVEIYRRGNLMYYGQALNDSSDYGSVPDESGTATWTANTAYAAGALVKVANTTDSWDFDYYRANTAFTSGASFTPGNWTQLNNQDLMPLDGRTIRLRRAANVNDPVAMVTYLTDVSSFRTSYMSRSIKVIDTSNHDDVPIAGQVVQVDLATVKQFSLTDFGYAAHVEYNPDSLEVQVNGQTLVPALQAGTANAGSGQSFDYDRARDAQNRQNVIVFDTVLRDKDIITVRWFDNVIGTLLEWDTGDDNIQNRADQRYLQSLQTFNRSNKIRYTDPANPSAPSAEVVPGTETGIRWTDVVSFLESIYPVGSVYCNANNAANPADYMGFGRWERFAQGQALVGWQDANAQGQYDPDFGYNNQFRDGQNQPMPVAGGIGGNKSVTLVAANIPELISGIEDRSRRNDANPNEQYALVARSANGDLNLNGCQPDPDSNAPLLGLYAEEPIKVNAGVTPTGVSVLQPYITVYTWIRTE